MSSEIRQRFSPESGAGDFSERPGKSLNIRDQIVQKRRERIKREGYGLGVEIPQGRSFPLVSFVREPLLICEIKRRSPSRGDIAPGADPLEQARRYYEAGVRSVSVLTEEDHFSGSLADLMAVKAAFPDLAVLRKDFLIDENDVLVSYRAGADAILLIASMLSVEELGKMLKRAESLSMSVLVEVHDEAEIEKIRGLSPSLVGINSRNLENFRIDRLLPLGLRPKIDWDSMVVFESGIFTYEDSFYTKTHRFQGVLVGEAVMRKPEVIPDLVAGLRSFAYSGLDTKSRRDLRELGLKEGANLSPGQWPGPSAEGALGVMPPRPWRFWQVIAEKVAGKKGPKPRPLVKICGLCREEDARLAESLGADLLGFVFADSPRKSNADCVRAVRDLEALKVAVVVDEIPEELDGLIREGFIDAVQFSGNEGPERCGTLAWPYYKALRPKNLDDLNAYGAYRSPRILVDAWAPGLYGGSGKVLDPEMVRAAWAKGELWMAGGIGPDNVADLVDRFSPELVDLSSSLESSPGVKDEKKMKKFFEELHRAVQG